MPTIQTTINEELDLKLEVYKANHRLNNKDIAIQKILEEYFLLMEKRK